MSVKLEVGKRYVSRNGSSAKVVARNDDNKRFPFIAVFDYSPDDPMTFKEDGCHLSGDEESDSDLIAEAPQTVDVWFLLDSKGSVFYISLIEPKNEGYKIAGPVRVEVPR